MMRVPIDVVWVREDEPGLLEVVSLDIALKPWRFFAAPRGAPCVEFRAESFDPDDPAGPRSPPGTKGIGDTVRNAANHRVGRRSALTARPAAISELHTFDRSKV